jgi:ATP-dependent DNA helicase RecG
MRPSERDYLRMIRGGESQFVEFKRAAVEARHLAEDLVALANADGGTVFIGVEDDGCVSGIEGYQDNVDELLRTPYVHCVPPVEAQSYTFTVEAKTVLALDVAYSTQVHETTGKAVYLRVGRKNQRLGVNDILRLAYAKGQAALESKPVEEAAFEDLDQALIADYCVRIGATGNPRDVLYSRDLLLRQEDRLVPTLGCVLLFAQRPQRHLPRCGLDFLKFEGIRQLVGQELNIVKREIIERPLPRLLERAFEVIGMQVREYSRLGQDGVFHTTPEYPTFAWQEAVVNAVAHRDYSITGKSIQVRMFDDRLEVESPGKLPGHVRLDNLVQERFSRNPQIVRVLIEFGYMKDIGEGIDRMIAEMEKSGLPAPEFSEPNYSFTVALKNTPVGVEVPIALPAEDRLRRYLREHRWITNQEYRGLMGVDRQTAWRQLTRLVEAGELVKEGKGRYTRYRLPSM